VLEQLVGQFVQSGAGKDILAQLGQQGLEAPQAQAALTATAEGVMQHGAGAGGLAGMLGGLMGGDSSAAGGLGGLGALGGLVGMLGGSAPAGSGAPAGGGLAAMAAPVAQFVAQKTGLSPAIAQMVVSVALPKVIEMFTGAHAAAASGQPAAPGAAPAAGGMLEGLLGGLLK
jgi:hypothetical protein